MRRTRALPLAIITTLISSLVILTVATAQSAVPGDITLICPHVASPVDGQQISCTYRVEAAPPTTTPPTSSTTTTPSVTTTTTIPPVATTTTPPAEAAVGSDAWKATTGLTTPVSSLTTVNSSFTTTADNQVIDSKRITGDLVVQHANVVVTNTRILGVVRGSNLRNLVLRNVDLGRDSCPGATNGGTRLINAGNYTLENTRLHHNGADLVNLAAGTITIRNSWLGQTCYYDGDHLDAIQMYNPGQNVTLLVEKSFLDARAVNTGAYGNGAVFISDSPGANSKFTLKNNLFAGGNHNVTWFHDRGTYIVQDNKYVAGSWSAWHDLQYLDRTPCDTNIAITFTGNKLDDGTPVTC